MLGIPIFPLEGQPTVKSNKNYATLDVHYSNAKFNAEIEAAETS